MVHHSIVWSLRWVWNLEAVGLMSALYGIRVSNFLPPIGNSDKVMKILE